MTHLQASELNGLRQTLTDERTRLRGEIREHLLVIDKERYSDVAGQVHDTGDESVADLLADVDTAVVGRLITELREVEAALERIAEGSYGLCDECGAEIPYARLQAYPTAIRCVADQERHEKLYAEENKPTI